MEVHQQHQQHVIHVVESGPGCCGVPKEAPCSVTGARGCAICAIIVHVGALLVFGWLWLWQWIASVLAFIMCGVLLCMYDRCAYITGGILFAVAAVFDILVLLEWIAIYNSLQDLVDDSDDYYNYYNDDDEWEDWKNAILWFALPPFLGALSLGLGALFSFASLCFWKDAGSPAAAMAATTAHVPAPQHTVSATYQPQNEHQHHERYHHQQHKAADPQQVPPSASERPPPPGYYQ
ncbi:unnamed protein product [Ectocarpus sp. 12 AP-2014]